MGSRRDRPPLIDGRNMHCPRCRKAHDILQYVPLLMIEAYEEETTPVYKCPSCTWVFAPAEHIVLDTAPVLREVAVG